MKGLLAYDPVDGIDICFPYPELEVPVSASASTFPLACKMVEC